MNDRPEVESVGMWTDPDAGYGGILLSDRIRFYVEQVGLLYPFESRRLAPASYDLALGSECWYADHVQTTGEPIRKLSPGEKLILEPNSIVYVSSLEQLNLPFYLVGRFNLKLRLLHEGLLVGTGPQVDPGFRGRLSCPLHNISNSRVSITCGEPFAVIEFQKTTPFAHVGEHPNGIKLSEIRRYGEAGEFKGLGGHSCLTFPARSLDRAPVERYVPTGKLVASSMHGLADRQEKLEHSVDQDIEEVRGQMRTMNLLAYLSVAAVAVSLGAYFWGAVGWYKSVNDSAVQALERVKTLESEREDIERRLGSLEERLKGVSSVSSPPPARR